MREHIPPRRYAAAGRIARLALAGTLLVAVTAAGPAASASSAKPPKPPETAASGTWSQTGKLNFARSTHTATLLPDGQVLVIAGGNRRIEKYNPQTRTWSEAGMMTVLDKQAPTSTLLRDGTVLIAGGRLWDQNHAEIYDPVSKTSTVTGKMTTPRYNHAAVRLQDGRVLVVGGVNSEVSPAVTNSTAEIYDPATRLWTAAGDTGQPRAGDVATLLNDGRVLVTGGSWPAEAQTDARLFDPQTGVWSATTPMPIPARSGTLLPDGTVLVTTTAGCASNPGSCDVHAATFNPSTEQWTPTGAMPLPGTGPRVLLPNGTVLAVGISGIPTCSTAGLPNSNDDCGRSFIYDPGARTWSETATMPGTARLASHPLVGLLNGTVLAPGGDCACYSTGPTQDATIYTP